MSATNHRDPDSSLASPLPSWSHPLPEIHSFTNTLAAHSTEFADSATSSYGLMVPINGPSGCAHVKDVPTDSVRSHAEILKQRETLCRRKVNRKAFPDHCSEAPGHFKVGAEVTYLATSGACVRDSDRALSQLCTLGQTRILLTQNLHCPSQLRTRYSTSTCRKLPPEYDAFQHHEEPAFRRGMTNPARQLCQNEIHFHASHEHIWAGTFRDTLDTPAGAGQNIVATTNISVLIPGFLATADREVTMEGQNDYQNNS